MESERGSKMVQHLSTDRILSKNRKKCRRLLWMAINRKKLSKSYQDFPRGMNTIPNITNQLSRFRFYLNKQDRQTTHNDEDS